MICDKAPEFQETTRLIYQMNEDEKVRIQCQQREGYEKHERTMLHKLEVAEAALSDAKSKLSDAESRLSDTESQLSASQEELALLKKRLAKLEQK